MDERTDQVDSGYRDGSVIRPADAADMYADDTYASGTSSAETDPEEIRAEIEETRAHMSGTIDEIQDRLSPTNIKDQAVGAVREATVGKAEDMVRGAGDAVTDARYGLMETVRQNPLPAALTGLGLVMLWRNRKSGTQQHRGSSRSSYYYGGPYESGYDYSRSGGYSQGGYQGGYQGSNQGGYGDQGGSSFGDKVGGAQDRVGEVAGQAQQKVGQVAGQAQQAAGQAVSQVQDTAGRVAEQAQYKAQRLEDRFQQTLHESPLAVGAVAAALGAAVGLLLPETPQEERLMGSASSNLMHKAQETAQEKMQQVQQVAQETLNTAKDTAQSEAQSQGLTSS